MIRQDIPATDEVLWKEYVEKHNAFMSASSAFYTKVSKKVELVKLGLDNPSERVAAFRVAEQMQDEELQQLFPDLLALASFSHGLTHAAQRLILKLPRQWLLENIETYAEPLLVHDDFEEYRGLLGLYFAIDSELTYRLAKRAAEHDDYDIQEAGQDFLAKLGR